MPKCSSFETSNRDDALAHARDVYHPRTEDIRTAGPFHLRHRRVDHDAWTSDSASMSSGGFRVEPYGIMSVCRVRAGRVRLVTGRATLVLQQGDTFVLADGVEPVIFTCDHAEVTALRLPLDALERVAREAAPASRGARPTFLTRHPVTTSAGRRLTRIVGFADRQLTDDAAPPGSVLREAIVNLLAATVLTTFPNTLVTDPSALPARDDVPTTVALALDFVARNADLPITSTDIAAHASVSRRALEMAFRQHLATSPAAYVRRYRLDRVHEELTDAQRGDGTTVTTVAARWGFTPSSRFAAYYRRVYGEPPKATLHRSP